MKKADLNKLKKVVEHYEKIEKLLDDAYDSIEKGDIERIEFGGLCRNLISTSALVQDMYKEARMNRKWIQSKVEMIEEQLTVK